MKLLTDGLIFCGKDQKHDYRLTIVSSVSSFFYIHTCYNILYNQGKMNEFKIIR